MLIRPLSKELQEKAKSELYEVPSRVQEDLKFIREWLSTQPHYNGRTDDQWLLSFLRGCKFNYQRTKDKLSLLYKKKTQIPEFFANRDPFSPEIQEVLKRGIVIVLPETANVTGPKITLIRTHRLDPVKVPIPLFVKVLLMVLEILYVEDDSCIVAGICWVIDLKDLSCKYLMQATPRWLKNIVVCALSAYPARVKEVHYINSPSFFGILYRLLCIFLPKKVKNRVQFHNDFDNISENIPQSILPKEYGGEGKPCDELAAEWKLKVEGYRDWFLEGSNSCTTNEIQQFEEANITDAESSFGKLEID